MNGLNIAIDSVEVSEKTIVTLEFNGIVDFEVDSNGELVDGNKTITVKELYEAIRPPQAEAEVELGGFDNAIPNT